MSNSTLAHDGYDGAHRLRRRKLAAATLAACLAALLAAALPASADHNEVPHAPGDPNRAYELVSPAYKASGAGLGLWYEDFGDAAGAALAAYDAERVVVTGSLGSVLLDENGFAYASDNAFAERVDDRRGWVSHPSITLAASRSQAFHATVPHAVSDDLSLLTWATNSGGLKLFPEMESWTDAMVGNPEYLGDWAGQWEVFGPLHPDQVPADLGNARANMAVAADGGYAVGQSQIKGMAGPGDPSVDLADGFNITTYLFDASAGLSNSFPGDGVRSLVHVCTAGTVLPDRVEVGADFRLDERVCPDPEEDRDATLISDRGGQIESGGRFSTENVISRDGSRVFFMSPGPDGPSVPKVGCSNNGEDTLCPPQLYVRQDNGDGDVVTRWLSRAQNDLFGEQAASLAGEAFFEGASEDGDRVFFRSRQPLTADDPNGLSIDSDDPRPIVDGAPSNSSWDLYMFELVDGADPTGPGSKLTRVSAGPEGDGDCQAGNGGGSASSNDSALRFASRDGSRLYFTCQGVLPGVGEASNGTITSPTGTTASTTATTNLYMYENLDGHEDWRFVAQLPRATGSDTRACATTAPYGGAPLTGSGWTRGHCVRGNSDGSFVTLWTPGELTEDDPDSSSMDIYAYDATADELTRITRGEVDEPDPYPCGLGGTAASTDCYGDGGFELRAFGGAGAPAPMLGVATDPPVVGDRVAFFQSRSRLVAEDTDDAYDVYMWRKGAGESEGSLSLVSTGASDTDGAFYKGNDRTGTNVYFVTRDRLTWQDSDAVLDAYTARVGGGIAEPRTPICAVLQHACRAPGRSVAPLSPDSGAPGGGDNAVPDARVRLAVGRPGIRARRRAARRGVLAVRVRASRAGRVRALARARIRGRTRLVARGAVRLQAAGRGVVRLRLVRPVRRRLARGRRVRLVVRVGMAGAPAERVVVVLRRAGR